MQTFHFEMFEGNKFVEIFKIHSWLVPAIPFFYKEEITQKLPLCKYYFLDSSLLKHFQNFLFH